VTDAVTLNAVLPSQTALYAVSQIAPAGTSYTYQRSYLPFLSVEFLRLGAQQIGIRGEDPSSREVASLSPDFASHVRIIDPSNRAVAQVETFLAPVFKEIPVEFRLGGFLHRGPQRENPEVVEAVAALRNSLIHFILGITHRMQVELDLPTVVRQLDLLDKRLTDNSARLVVTEFYSILMSYKTSEVKSFSFTSTTEKERINTFLELVELPEYRQLSEELACLGVPGQAKKALSAVERLVTWIRRRLKKTVAVGSTAVGIASLGKVTLDGLRDVLPEEPQYFPPLISFAAARAEATARFRKDKGLSTSVEKVGDQVLAARGRLMVTMPGTFSRAEIDLPKRELGASPIGEHRKPPSRA
jgi:hypothetical protein